MDLALGLLLIFSLLLLVAQGFRCLLDIIFGFHDGPDDDWGHAWRPRRKNDSDAPR